MKIFFISFFPVLILFSCSEIEKDCICTGEFRFYLVTVVDTLGVPVDSLTVIIKDKDGDELDVQQDPFFLDEGKYTVLNDSFTHIMFAYGTPQVIYFSVTDGIRAAKGEFMFNTDECKCHINKVSGPDTLVLR
ncbi:MAG: hypothetical protein B6D44_00780 [Ignavibacteriales bacterium UTCHB2]|jgi:hypothetical protein|nr:hypothetical protein [Ignavibacterium sp.]OQY75763.1 MAG: hypothetical protein B6D44_00780 [Ignavibacteriales bacterium UTCHB2]